MDTSIIDITIDIIVNTKILQAKGTYLRIGAQGLLVLPV